VKSPLIFALAAALIGIVSGPASAQPYPSRTVSMVVPFPAGGAVDLVARILVKKLNETMGQHFIVENRPGGASGIVGANAVAKSPPDGYTLLESASVHVINPMLYKSVPYDVVNDFTPIILVADAPLLVATHPSIPANNLKEFFDLVRKNPDKFTFGASTVGSASHLVAELLKRDAKINTQIITYRGTAPGLTDLMSNTTQLFADTMISSLSIAQGGKSKPLAVTSLKRMPQIPDVPTVEESAGFKGFEFVSWYGVWGPKGMPADMTKKLQTELDKILKMPDVKEQFDKVGFNLKGGTSQEFADYIRVEMAKYKKIIDDANIKVEQ
jgi:tripartite-type tricarboxylate transporter receptor subunit TctC